MQKREELRSSELCKTIALDVYWQNNKANDNLMSTLFLVYMSSVLFTCVMYIGLQMLKINLYIYIKYFSPFL